MSHVSFSNIISMEDIKAESVDGAEERERVDICSFINHVHGRVGRASPLQAHGAWTSEI